MRKLWLTALIALVSLELLARADEPRAVIEKAVKAYGGEEKLAKLKAVRAKAKGTLFVGAEVPFTWETAWQAPDRYKAMAELGTGMQKVALTMGFDGAAGWATANGAVAPLTGKKLDDLLATVNLRRVLTLTPLLTDKAYELTALDDVKIDGKPAAGVKVAAKGQKDVSLYFDKETGLLARVDHLVFDDRTMKDVLQEDHPSEFKDIDGIKTAMKEVWQRSGVKVAELTWTEVSYPGKIEAREFAKPAPTVAVPADLYTRKEDVVYGHKLGMALVMDVFTPKKGANGAAIIFVVSGGWVSDHNALTNPAIGLFLAEPLKRGYTVFAVTHGSQPRFVIPEAIEDLNRAVRFIRLHARDYQIDPDRIGITGGSAGGHLSLMQGTAGDKGDPKAAEPIDRTSSRVQAVAALFPPTDFLNYGGEGKYAFAKDGILSGFRTAVDVREFDPKTGLYERVTDEKKALELAKKISPITHVSADDPPTLIVHGDADTLVPIQQAELILAKFKEAGVTAELVTRKGRGHDFNGIDKDVVVMVDWFDKHLKKK